MFFINCGALEDIPQLLQLPEATQVVVVDSHRSVWNMRRLQDRIAEQGPGAVAAAPWVHSVQRLKQLCTGAIPVVEARLFHLY